MRRGPTSHPRARWSVVCARDEPEGTARSCLASFASGFHGAPSDAGGGRPDARGAASIGRRLRIRAKSRDNARTPIPWTDAPNGGFTSGTPWLRLAPHRERTNTRTQRADPGSVLHHYRRLIALGKALPALVRGDVEQLAEAHARPDDGSQAGTPTVAPAMPLAGWEARVYHRAGGCR